jgi:hypothetical protein
LELEARILTLVNAFWNQTGVLVEEIFVDVTEEGELELDVVYDDDDDFDDDDDDYYEDDEDAYYEDDDEDDDEFIKKIADQGVIGGA